MTAGDEQLMRSEPAPLARRRWLQFSLRTALLLVAFAAVGFSLLVSYGQWRENRRLRADVLRLKNGMGELDIEPGTEHQLHAVRLMPVDEGIWKWNVYVPNNPPCYLIAGDRLDGTEGATAQLNPGYNSITVSLRRNLQDRWEWKIRHYLPSGTLSSITTFPVSAENEKLIHVPTVPSGILENTTGDPEGKLELLRYQFREVGVPASVMDPSKPGGVVVWISTKRTTP